MTSAYVLIAAVLVLGGLISALGDRLGTKVGKARLRLFNLRPRQTAVVVTIVTGVLIAASTLGILFGLSESLREGIFELDEILRERRRVEKELTKVTEQKEKVEAELTEARNRQQQVQQGLETSQRDFRKAQEQLKNISKQLQRFKQELQVLLKERQQLLGQRDKLKQQINTLQSQTKTLQTQIGQLKTQIERRDRDLAVKNRTLTQKDTIISQREREISQQTQQIDRQEQQIQQREREIAQQTQQIDRQEQQIQQRDREIAQREADIAAQEITLKQQEASLTQLRQEQNELEELIQGKDEQIAQLDEEIAVRDKELENREMRLADLESQLEFLKQEVATLEQYYQNYQVLRQGNLALVRGQVLSSAVVRVVDPLAVSQAIDKLLRDANRNAIKATSINGNNQETRVVQITNAQVRQLINQIKDGRDYVVRVLSAENYVQGEEQVRVFADVTLNQEIFPARKIIATISLERQELTEKEAKTKLDLLLSATQFRARRAGIVGQIQVEEGNIATIIDFLEQLQQSTEPLDEIRAVVAQKTFTAGPLKLRLLALVNNEVIFSSVDAKDLSPPENSPPPEDLDEQETTENGQQ